MTYLIIQIALFLLAAAFIGWLMGRSVSKNRERELDNDYHELNTKHASLEEYRDRMNRDYFSLKERDKEKSNEIVLLKKQLTDARVKNETYKLEHYDMKLKYEKLSNEREDNGGKLEKERTRFQGELDNAQVKIKEMMDRISVLASEKRNADARITQLSDEREELTRRSQNHSDSELELNNKLRDLDAEREKIQSEAQSLLNERIELKKRISSLIEENQSLNTLIADLKLNQENTVSQARNAAEELEDITTQMIDLRKQRDNYQKKLHTISKLVDPVKS